ncbi:MAG: hypothetical protein ACYTEL_17780 [Planctomycetota bacterium]|jgi:hypothetical protein
MRKNKLPRRGGFTITELVISIVACVIVTLVVGVVLADGQRGWNKMFNRTYSEIVTDSYVARRTFDLVVRNASRERFELDAAGNWLEVYTYSSDTAPDPDHYARFYVSGDQLMLERGQIDPRSTLSVDPICSNVSNCTFCRIGRSAQMVLTLDDGTQSATVTCSAVLHNE